MLKPFDGYYNVYGTYHEHSASSATSTQGYYSYIGGKTRKGFYISVFGGTDGQECSYYACGKLGSTGISEPEK